jgi:hypothetical protein
VVDTGRHPRGTDRLAHSGQDTVASIIERMLATVFVAVGSLVIAVQVFD